MREFGSRRLDQLSNRYSMSMTNFWPYLNQFRRDLLHKRRACEASLLGKFFDGFIPISSEIWGCPENDKQLTMALRFLLARIWFIIMLDELDRDKAKNSIVVGAQEVVKDEIWSISLATRRKSCPNGFIQTFYVLESTCEVIGLPPVSGIQPSCESDESGLWQCQKRHLRGDWSDYVENCISNVDCPPLLNYIKWTNAEEYKKGISKLWLSKIAKEGAIGAYKKRVAERYVLACVVGNSISGQWMSSSLMAQVFAGTASGVEPGPTSLLRKREAQKVNLFLPEHHLVESVHFTTSGPKPRYLHRALAVVQTPRREYFILKDNGMEVGCEEDGVWPAWMELLGCNARGIACS
ncbi:uncharacterized protein FOMMEDRAFT_23970 [Fomitiporia mediterranea MF3/22]|uniref:uncharacterized protein n=1 Tax=Fomitiporia mediterranea (strain MF3/22) TaxID=694068 RepID=UPI00044085E9|nr:uncharacterized protein FOMMEDRAFT_23970 [Fomitiporia mediterranea MF3/22]EJC97904.1 hypothetical protein FOMMEDRAFT_23970 [Fomitiporia mediterranea MF3/22]